MTNIVSLSVLLAENHCEEADALCSLSMFMFT